MAFAGFVLRPALNLVERLGHIIVAHPTRFVAPVQVRVLLSSATRGRCRGGGRSHRCGTTRTAAAGVYYRLYVEGGGGTAGGSDECVDVVELREA